MNTTLAGVTLPAPEAARSPVRDILHTQGSVHLDALRGAAAILVFVNHSRALYFSSVVHFSAKDSFQLPHSELGSAGGELTLATEAVVIFFVLSGFLVGGSTLRGIRSTRWSWKDYLVKRITRLFVVLVPALLLGVALDHAGILLFGSTSIYGNPAGLEIRVTDQLAEHLKPGVLLGNLLFLQGILCPSAGTNRSLWSLANEFWYYLIFPFLAFALFSRWRFRLRVAAAVIACLILVFTGSRIALLFPIWMAGALICTCPPWPGAKHMNVIAPAFAGMLLTVMLGVRLSHVKGLAGVYIVGIATCTAVYVFIQDSRPSRMGMYRRAATFLSQISYSLYLFHLPLAVFLCGFLNSPWRSWAKTPRNLAAWAAGDVIILVVTYGLWRVFEANTGRIRSRIFGVA